MSDPGQKLETSMSGGSTPRKRVRFKEDDTLFHPKNRYQEVTQGVDPMEALEGEIHAVSLTSDAQEAAAHRARLRRAAALMARYDDPKLWADTDTDMLRTNPFEAAEVEYTEPEELFNEVGIPFEPFHMRVENEEGYFDQETTGKDKWQQDNDSVSDAWMDCLPLFPASSGDQVGTRWQGQWSHVGASALPTASGLHFSEATETEDMSSEDALRYKERIIQLLQPGENVLQALRRLGNPGTPRPSTLLNSLEGDTPPERKHGQVDRRQQLNQGEKPALRLRVTMSSAAKADFDSLTEASSLLMEAGEHGIHSTPREDLEVSLALDGIPAIATSLSDSEILGSSGVPNPQGSSVLPACLNGGSRLPNAVHATKTAAAGRDGSGWERKSVPCDSDSMYWHGIKFSSSPYLSMPLPVPTDGVQDMFAECGDGDGWSTRGGTGGTLGGSCTHASSTTAQTTAGIFSQEARETALRSLANKNAAGCGSGSSSTSIDGFQGFEWEVSSGYLYNSDLGCYYDPGTKLFGDALTGRWYSVDAASGTYTLVG